MSLLPFFEWCDNTRVAVVIRDSRVLFPIIETFHLFALTILLGTTVVISLRLIDVTMRRQPIVELADDLAPWSNGSIVVMLASGVLLFLSEALKCYGSSAFRVKMVLLLLALVFHITVFRPISRMAAASSLRRTIAGVGALALWFGVGLAGRGIAFLE
jgi:hypothetical protein